MKDWIRIKFVLFLIVISYATPLKSQYSGGIEDGNDMGMYVGTDLSGEISDASIIYFGSFDEGSAFAGNFSMIGGARIDIYSGSKDEGSYNIHQTLALAGMNLNALYDGSLDDGTTLAFVSYSLSGIRSNSLYSGGTGEGHDLKAFTNLLNAQIPFSIFNGGSNDGYSSKSAHGVVASPGISMYEGSYDEGTDNVKYIGPLDLTSQNLLFNGGADDGFVLEMESAFILTGSTNSIKQNITNKITLYPNPLIGKELYVKFHNDFSGAEITDVKLFTINGVLLAIDGYELAHETLQISLLNNLMKGNYIITVNTVINEYNIKFIVQ